MRNLKLQIEYDGAGYCGWQVQRRNKSVQDVLEKALRKILQEKIRLIVAGRTDAGTHAQAQSANFHTRSKIPALKLQYALNGILPKDISVSGIEEKALSFHSRFDAKSKIYRYTILNRNFPSALLAGRVYFYPQPLDTGLMRKEARCLLGRHDFKSFQAADKRDRGSVRTIKDIKVRRSRDFIYIEIEADGFLYNMVRNIAGTLIEAGRGRFPAGSIKRILLSRNRKLAGPTVPACGLCLLEVKY